MRNYVFYYIILIFILPLDLKSAKDNFKYEMVVSDLEIPWSFTFLPDNSILINEKKGEIIHFDNGKKTKIKNLPEIISVNQGGLMDIELHPEFENNGWIYISYSSSNDNKKGSNTSIMRFKLTNQKATDKEIIYKAIPNSKRTLHYGSRIVFDNKNYLFFSIGDRGNRDLNPQDLSRDGGKIYRLHDDGRIPIDNPFVNLNDSKKGIFSFGHRNPQGMFFNSQDGKVWIHEHGPRGGDELNVLQIGGNFGWPLASYGINYIGTKFTNKTSIDGMVDPLHYWVPSIAPSGLIQVVKSKYKSLNNSLLIGSLKFQYLHQCVMKDGKVIKEKKLLEEIGRVRSIEIDNFGEIYLGVENLGIVKLTK